MKISLLNQETIDKIAAGEVVSRPSSVVKELVENSIDAGADILTVEIKDGGKSMIRITDNGEGIEKEEIPTAFLRHATSKIRSVEDLLSIRSLGFRGEALSSIAAVSRVELITCKRGEMLGSRYLIEGGVQKSLEEIGAPEGSTFIVRSLFYNTPARLKFLKSDTTEAGYVSSLMENLALSHPEISFKFISGGQVKMHTSGSGSIKDVVYRVYGRQTAAQLLPVTFEREGLEITGYVGNPSVSRGNRDYEHYFVNGRYVRSDIISKAIEDAFQGRLMQHRYPFAVLQLTLDGTRVDVNVHPSKQQVRFSDNQWIYEQVQEAVRLAVISADTPQRSSFSTVREEVLERKLEKAEAAEKAENIPEPFEKIRSQLIASGDSPYEPKYRHDTAAESSPAWYNETPAFRQMQLQTDLLPQQEKTVPEKPQEEVSPRVPEDSAANLKIIGQIFSTYWIVESGERMFIIDQHAAHEKVIYERLCRSFKNREFTSQQLLVPQVVSLTPREETLYLENEKIFSQVGFEIDHFGGREYAIRAVPDNLYGFTDTFLFTQMLDSLGSVSGQGGINLIFEKLAGMACKAAVKGNHTLSPEEAKELLEEMMTLENPFNCPHGRPTMIEMSRYELDRKFKRII